MYDAITSRDEHTHGDLMRFRLTVRPRPAWAWACDASDVCVGVGAGEEGRSRQWIRSHSRTLDGSGWVRIELRVVAPYLAAEAPEHVPPRATDLIPAIRHTTVARPSRTIKNTRHHNARPAARHPPPPPPCFSVEMYFTSIMCMEVTPTVGHGSVHSGSWFSPAARQLSEQGGNLIAWLILFALHAGAGA